MFQVDFQNNHSYLILISSNNDTKRFLDCVERMHGQKIWKPNTINNIKQYVVEEVLTFYGSVFQKLPQKTYLLPCCCRKRVNMVFTMILVEH
jgi:hypothetical protein